jgi:iron(III) transport system ATP-binding protein
MVSVTLEHVTKEFGEVTAVRNVSLEIQEGELFFLLGPSGCGKTTLLRSIAGFYAPTAGRILFDNRDVSNTPPHKRNTGMVFQNYALWPHMTVWENVAYGLSLRKISSDKQKQRVGEALAMVRMEIYAKRSPNQLSGGQQQRVALARALVINPDVVLLDEPLSNLDAKLRLEMRDEIRRIHDETGTTMIYVTHDQKEALSMADRVAVMGMGEVRQTGEPRMIYTRPESIFVAGFIGETNFINGKIVATEPEIQIETSMGILHSTVKLPSGIGAGSQVVCSIRPESIHINEDGVSDQGNRIQAEVAQIMYLGEHEQYTLKLNEDSYLKLIDSYPDQRKAQTGDMIWLTIDASHVVVLEKTE